MQIQADDHESEPPGEARAVEVERLVATHLPGHPAGPVERLGEGTDHDAYLVAGRLVVRIGKEPDPAARAARTGRDALLLRTVGRVSPLPVPVPAFTVPDAGCIAYVPLAGVPLLRVPAAERTALAPGVAHALGGFLAALHALPAAAAGGLVETDLRTAAEWREEAVETCAHVAGAVPAAYRRRVAAFLDAPLPTEAFADVPLRFTHNDLGIEHVLVDPAAGRVTGIIDWSDAAVADPAADFARLERDLGPAAVDAALRAYREGGGGGLDAAATERLRMRAGFYARCMILEDLAYGLETGDAAYTEKSLAALGWLFPG
jgi:aminoglycoside phosphotransferase (APT) family kinase protein